MHSLCHDIFILNEITPKSCCDHWSQSPQITSALLAKLHRPVAFQVPDVLFHLQLFRTSTASVSMSAAAAAAAVVASAAAHLAPSMYSALSSFAAAAGLSSKLSCCWCTPWIRCRHWSQPGQGCYSRPRLAIFAYCLWWSTPSPSGPGRPHHTLCCCSTLQTLVLPSPHDRCPNLCTWCSRCRHSSSAFPGANQAT